MNTHNSSWFGGGPFFSNSMGDHNTNAQYPPSTGLNMDHEENKDDEKKNVYQSPAGIDNPNNDIVVPDAPTDTVTSLYFSPRNHSTDFVVTTWDKQVRHYRTPENITCQTANKSNNVDIDDDADNDNKKESPAAVENTNLFPIPLLMETKYHEKPVLDACWNGNDANKLYTVGCDRVVKVWDLEKNVFCAMDFQPSSAQSVQAVQCEKKSNREELQDDDSKQAEIATPVNDVEEVKNAGHDQEAAHEIHQDVRAKIKSKIQEWHPDIVEQISRKLFTECDNLNAHQNDTNHDNEAPQLRQGPDRSASPQQCAQDDCVQIDDHYKNNDDAASDSFLYTRNPTN